ncbi:MAG: TetR/AcrR family transcriptional regulator, fatty acid metabolism regulator protein [Candidatus Marinimicrobia bacterium]|nr:TetR/AcrR family transcriptional regulator, fatty acid metabolism regulator protein [Candidatus Neomarinimicrobiota bacterium]
MKTDRQKEIIHVSLELLSEYGIQGLTMKNLSKRIGISEPAIYRHFDNKVEILSALLDFFRHNNECFFEKEVDESIPAPDKIENILMNHFRVFTENPSLVTVIFAEELFRNEAALSDKVISIMEYNSSVIKTILDDGQAAGTIRKDIPAEHLILMILGALRLFVKKWQLTGAPFSLMDEGLKLTASLKCLLKPANGS